MVCLVSKDRDYVQQKVYMHILISRNELTVVIHFLALRNV